MDYRKSNAPTNTVTRDMMVSEETQVAIYEQSLSFQNGRIRLVFEMKQDAEKKPRVRFCLTTWRSL